MIILGIDPGTLVTGYGVIETLGAGRMRVIEYGTVEAKKIGSLPLRLRAIFTRLVAVIERTSPDEIALESAFYHKNVQSTLKLGHARGVAMLAGSLKDLTTAEYAPSEVKRAVAGKGGASKEQVEYMVRVLLNLKETDRKLPDAYDALAIAITHAARSGGPGKGVARNWKQFVEQHPERVQSPVRSEPTERPKTPKKRP